MKTMAGACRRLLPILELSGRRRSWAARLGSNERRHQIINFVAAMLLVGAAEAAEDSAAAIRDAKRLVECMKAFDANCAAALTYTEFLEARGAPRDQLIQGVTDLYKNLKSINARYTQFEISVPVSRFESDGLTYAFVPYVSTMEVPGRGGLKQRAFFIGISKDKGMTWSFVEGARATPQSIIALIPSYKGQPSMPAVTAEQVSPTP